MEKLVTVSYLLSLKDDPEHVKVDYKTMTDSAHLEYRKRLSLDDNVVKVVANYVSEVDLSRIYEVEYMKGGEKRR